MGTCVVRDGKTSLAANEIPQPNIMPSSPPMNVSVAASVRNCRTMSNSARADCFADSDLARSLRHGDQHDVHHADAADKQADGTEHDHDQRHHSGHVVELFDHLFGSGDPKLSGSLYFTRRSLTKNHVDFVHGLLQAFPLWQRSTSMFPSGREHLAHREVRQQHAQVFAAPGNDAAGRFITPTISN